ncbi:hypothetical protein DRF62_14675 [Chryseobacterium piscium]|uniref:Uncharacterized protein n=1 Tax=Chryseobacterium piscium TaxID=333702 RepID=A0A3D9BI16_9FLAO|nr:hypothetical protein DRF62_14675 [Chryseobacterium piscium]
MKRYIILATFLAGLPVLAQQKTASQQKLFPHGSTSENQNPELWMQRLKNILFILKDSRW